MVLSRNPTVFRKILSEHRLDKYTCTDMSQSVVLLKGTVISLLWMPVHKLQGTSTHEVSPRRGFFNGKITIQPCVCFVDHFAVTMALDLLRAFSASIVVCTVGILIYPPEDLSHH